MPVPENSRRERERELLQEVQKSQDEYHASPPGKRPAALKKYLQAVNRFSQFVLSDKSRPPEA
jgi:hypothetical protein